MIRYNSIATIRSKFNENATIKVDYENDIISVESELWEIVFPLFSEKQRFKEAGFYLINEIDGKKEYVLLKMYSVKSSDKENMIIDCFETMTQEIERLEKTKINRYEFYSKIIKRLDEKNIKYNQIKTGTLLIVENKTYCFGDFFATYKNGEFTSNNSSPQIFITYQSLEKEMQRIILEKMYG